MFYTLIKHGFLTNQSVRMVLSMLQSVINSITIIQVLLDAFYLNGSTLTEGVSYRSVVRKLSASVKCLSRMNE